MARAGGRIASAVWVVAFVGSTSAAAEPNPPTSAALAPALPPAQVTLKVTPGSGGGPWSLKIENTGEGPVRIPADPRLLVLDITPPVVGSEPASESKKNPKSTMPASVRCVLPDDTRPLTDEGRELVIPPKRSWSASFDPPFYCFGARERASLLPGHTVKAWFGWPAPPRPSAKPGKAPALKPPFAASPVGASAGKVSPVKAIEADPFTLTDAVLRAKTTAPTDETASSSVSLSVPEAIDAARGVELSTTVSLKNNGDRPITLLYRPNMLQFAVSGPAGNVSCGAPRTIASPIRELFITVPAKGKTETTVLFTTTCPAGTFDEPGIYRVLPRLDTTNASGRELGLKSWEGVAVAKSPLLVRVRTPRTPALPARPTLD